MKDQPLDTDLLLRAYAAGIFPMSDSAEDTEIFWVDPRRRGVMPLDGFHVSKSLARRMRRLDYTVAINRDFAGVVAACADRDETWINDTIFDLYTDLHRIGHAHSLEIRQSDKLVGGVYGVTLGAAFFGESMFSGIRDGSKLALAYLVDHLNTRGFCLFDTQFLTPHLASLGGIEITRGAYHSRLATALAHDADFTNFENPTPQEVIQRITQTS